MQSVAFSAFFCDFLCFCMYILTITIANIPAPVSAPGNARVCPHSVISVSVNYEI